MADAFAWATGVVHGSERDEKASAARRIEGSIDLGVEMSLRFLR